MQAQSEPCTWHIKNNFDNELAREWYKCTFHITAFDVVFQYQVSNA